MIESHVIAGHRVLRLLARGERSRVWLATGDAVLKVLTRPFGEGQPAREAEALHRARGDHVVELLDVHVDDEGAVLVFPRLPRGSLADLLVERDHLDAGEAVTALVPVARALERLHEAGVAHEALTPAEVLLSGDGAPVLTGFGSATLFEPGLPEVHRERVEGVVRDREALARLAEVVLRRVGGPRAAAAGALADALGRGATLRDLERRLVTELFELAAARPIAPSAPAVGPDRGVAGRLLPVADDIRPEAAPRPSAASTLPAWAALLDRSPVAAVRERVTAVWREASPGRRRLLVGSAVAGLAVLILAGAIPGTSAQSPEQEAVSVPTAVPDAPADLGAEHGGDPLAADEDPVTALRALLQRREQCFAALSVECLADVDHAGSRAAAVDRAALDEIVSSGAQPPTVRAGGAELVERLGDAALIVLGPDSDPASVLLMRTEAGWRIRDYLARDAGESG